VASIIEAKTPIRKIPSIIHTIINKGLRFVFFGVTKTPCASLYASLVDLQFEQQYLSVKAK
jgi:hypothetical protein